MVLLGSRSHAQSRPRCAMCAVSSLQQGMQIMQTWKSRSQELLRPRTPKEETQTEARAVGIAGVGGEGGKLAPTETQHLQL